MNQQPILLFKGDDSDAFNVRTITVRLTTDIDLTNATARFDLLSYSVTFSNAVTRTKTFPISFTAAHTKAFPLGVIYGKLRLYDSTGRTMTARYDIPFRVVLAGCGEYGPCAWHNACGNAVVDVYLGVDYAYVFNKPTIDNVVVDGDKDAHDYGIAKLTDIVSVSLLEELSPTSEQGVKSKGIWKHLWGTLTAIPGAATSLYAWATAAFDSAGTANTKVTEHNTSSEAHAALFGAKQDTIADLETIRSGAAAGATAVQPSSTVFVKSDALAGTTMPPSPTQRELATAVKTLWQKLGGTIS